MRLERVAARPELAGSDCIRTAASTSSRPIARSRLDSTSSATSGLTTGSSAVASSSRKTFMPICLSPRAPTAPVIHFVIVTGLSGAGKSQAAKCLEDLGYFCVDNLPPSLIPKFAELCTVSSNLRNVAVVLDIRGEEIFGDLLSNLGELQRDHIPHRVVFLDASDPVLVRRFSETRRKQPLSDRGRVSDSIAAEREELKPIRDAADVIIDTSSLTLSALK